MVEIPKHVARVTKLLADGSTRIYHYAWRGGPQLKGEPGSAEFMASYAAAKAEANAPKAAPPVVPMVAGLIDRYRRSEDFRSKAESTRREYDRYLRIIEKDFGDMPLAVLDDRTVRGEFKDWRDEMADRPRTADFAWSVLARLMSFAEDRGEIDRNPCLKGGRLYTADRNEKIWTEELLRRLIAVASPQVMAAVTFALWTGQRMSDCIAAEWTAFDAGKIKVTQSKGDRRMLIPVAPTLAALLTALPHTGAATILTNSRGQPWTRYGLSCSFRKATVKAGIDLHFHDLRGTAVTRMALAGCTALQIAAITGHSPQRVNDILENHYLGGQVELAEQAIARLDFHVSTPPANQATNRLQTASAPPGYKPWT